MMQLCGTCIGIQHHEFATNEEFITWKENEEATSNTHYILHNQPYVMSSSENDGKCHSIKSFAIFQCIK